MNYVSVTRKHKGKLLSALLGFCPNDGAEWTQLLPMDENGQVQASVTLCGWCGTESAITNWEVQDMEWDANLHPRRKQKS